MDPERWRRIEALLAAALEVPPGSRAAFLKQQCPDDDTLRREVEALLASAGKMGSFLEWTEDGKAPGRILGPEEGSMVGRRIGPYRVLAEVGRGGMGAVYLCVRDDDVYEKRVSIKLVRPGRDSKELLRRFRRERQILASLEHENIGKLFDGGTAEDGRPYFVMEHVEGRPIDKYCDIHRLTVEKRLRLFRQVCSAVQYAHQNLIVHRDLKPTNILVTRQGVPKLLDFGVAKLLHEFGISDLSRTGSAFGTPEYASPEQIRGDPITTATDIYSLGVLLYELLTGARPHPRGKRSFDELAQRICEELPTRPSAVVLETNGTAEAARKRSQVYKKRRTTPAQLSRRLRGDLDNILLKALHKDPQHRYASVEQLSEDLRCHLDALPVMASPQTFSYRAGKFVRRHTLGVAASAALGMSLLLGIGATSWMSIVAARNEASARQAQATAEGAVGAQKRARMDAEEARGEAETARDDVETARDEVLRETRKVQAVNQFLMSMLASADPYGFDGKGSDVTIGAVLQEAAARLEKDFAGSPAIAAAVHDSLGLSYLGLGLLQDAERQLRAALEIRRGLFGEEHPEFATSLIHVHHHLFLESVWADNRVPRKDYEEAIAMLKKAAEIRQRHLGERHHLTTEILGYLSNLQQIAGDPQADKTLVQAITATHRGGRRTREQVAEEFERRLASLRLRWSSGDRDGALGLVQETLAPFIEHPVLGTSIWGAVCTFGESRRSQGDDQVAEALYVASIQFGSKALGPDHPDIGRCHWELANLLHDRRDLHPAEEEYREAVAILGERLDPQAARVLGVKNDLASVLIDLRKLDEAENLLADVLATAQQAFPADNLRRVLLEASYGRLLMLKGRYRKAEDQLLACYGTLEKRQGEDPEAAATVAQYLVDLYDAWGKKSKARKYRALRTSLSEPVPQPSG